MILIKFRHISYTTAAAIPHILIAGAIGVGLSLVIGVILEILLKIAGVFFDVSVLDNVESLDQRFNLELADFTKAMLIGVTLEELIFRKFGFFVLKSDGLSTKVTLLLTSLAFGGIHLGGGAPIAIYATLAGGVFGWLYCSPTFRFTKVMVAHLTANFTAYFYAHRSLAGDSIDVSTHEWSIAGLILLFAVGVILNLQLTGQVTIKWLSKWEMFRAKAISADLRW